MLAVRNIKRTIQMVPQLEDGTDVINSDDSGWPTNFICVTRDIFDVFFSVDFGSIKKTTRKFKFSNKYILGKELFH